MKQAMALIIGDEILAGHTQDTNTNWLARRLKSLGIQFARVEVCTDQVADISASLLGLAARGPDYIITSGGLGPTPDDRTMDAIAAALGVELTLDPKHEQWMRERVAEGHRRGYFDSPEPNKGLLKMGYLPKGTKAMPNLVGTALGCIATIQDSLVFTLPGVPSEFVRMFEEGVLPSLETGEPLHVAELVLRTEESRFYEILVDLEQRYPEVGIGSYPERGRIRLRATGPKEQAEAVIAELREAGRAYE